MYWMKTSSIEALTEIKVGMIREGKEKDKSIMQEKYNSTTVPKLIYSISIIFYPQSKSFLFFHSQTLITLFTNQGPLITVS